MRRSGILEANKLNSVSWGDQGQMVSRNSLKVDILSFWRVVRPDRALNLSVCIRMFFWMPVESLDPLTNNRNHQNIMKNKRERKIHEWQFNGH